LNKPTKYVFYTISINLVIAFLIFISIIDFDIANSIKVILDLKLNFFVGISGLFIIGYFLGNKLNKILENKGGLKIVHGIISILLILLFGILIGSTVGYLEEGLPSYLKYGDLQKTLFDYYFKPLFWIMFFGLIPTLISGVFLGYFLKKLK